jgi:Flp pilus assembly protein TadG
MSHLGGTTMRTGEGGARRERGQIIVIFALGLVALVGMVGLILDGGSTYAQRRSQQNAADLASLTGANHYLLNGDQTAATAAARANAAANGFQHGAQGISVNVLYDFTVGAEVKVDIQAPHRNTFSSVMGFNTWNVSTTATARTGIPDTAVGAAPVIFSIDAFGSDGKPLPAYGTPGVPYTFGEANGDVPVGSGDLAWTNYGTGNVNTDDVRDIMGGTLVITKTLAFGEYIGQHNQGNHTALYDANQSCAHKPSINGCYAGTNIVVPIVDHNGNFQGWATFHVVSAAGGSSKTITGWFVDNYPHSRLSVGACSVGNCPRYLGSYELRLVD